MKTYTFETKYGRWHGVQIVKAIYQETPRLYLGLITQGGEPLADITVWLRESLDDGEIIVKDWSENEGMAKWLEKNGIANRTGREVQTGYVQAPIMRLTPEFMNEYNITKTINIPHE